jgi:RimJ/RimL family protein N-acetyltransferase
MAGVGAAQPELRTERLLLRRWRPVDLDQFAAINADPQVMEHYPAALSREESAALIERIAGSFEDHGYGLWAVEITGETPFAGYVGLDPVGIEVPFAPAVELGWRLGRNYWGRGIASEAANASIAFAFERLGLRELVAYTAAVNARSRRLMERLAMTRDPAEDFLHPRIAAGDRLAPHVLYRLDAGDRRPKRVPNMLDACAGATPTPPDPKN